MCQQSSLPFLYQHGQRYKQLGGSVVNAKVDFRDGTLVAWRVSKDWRRWKVCRSLGYLSLLSRIPRGGIRNLWRRYQYPQRVKSRKGPHARKRASRTTFQLKVNPRRHQQLWRWGRWPKAWRHWSQETKYGECSKSWELDHLKSRVMRTSSSQVFTHSSSNIMILLSPNIINWNSFTYASMRLDN